MVFSRNYLSDVWLKETQRALADPAIGFSTCQRRWVHVFINGYYWGVYDLEEHLDADTVSAHLTAKFPAQASAAKPGNILFGLPMQLPEFSDSALSPQWWYSTVVPAALAVRNTADGTPARTAAWTALTAILDIDSYIDYICTLATVQDRDQHSGNIRVWRHPLTNKWHCIAWDGDYIGWHANFASIEPVILNSDTIIDDQEAGLNQLSVHLALSGNSTYRTAFRTRLENHLANGALRQSQIAARFEAVAADFRQTLECEALRWGRPLEESAGGSLGHWSSVVTDIKSAVTNNHAPFADTPSTYNTIVRGGILSGILPANFPYLPTTP